MGSIRQYILGHEALRKPYYALGDIYHFILSRANPEKMSKKFYRGMFGRELDLDDPKTVNEKMMYLKLKKYWMNPYTASLADKYKAREYVKRCGLGHILTECYGVWDDAGKIDWDALPEKFAIKCNHGSGYNLICKDKSAFDTKRAAKQLNRWLRERYGVSYVEQGIYDKIERRILAEEFIETADGLPPHDYKFFCSYGSVKYILVASDRYAGHTKYDYYEPDFTYLPIVKVGHNADGGKPKPENFDELVHCAERLSKPFPLVRVDLYSEVKDGKRRIFFGEMTFSPSGALSKLNPSEYETVFGARFPDIEELRKFEVTAETISGAVNKTE